MSVVFKINATLEACRQLGVMAQRRRDGLADLTYWDEEAKAYVNTPTPNRYLIERELRLGIFNVCVPMLMEWCAIPESERVKDRHVDHDVELLVRHVENGLQAVPDLAQRYLETLATINLDPLNRYLTVALLLRET